MRVCSYVMFTMDIEEARAIFEMIGHRKHHKADRTNPDSNLRFQAIGLFTDSEEYRTLIGELKRRGIKYEERFTNKFSREELETAEFLWMISGHAWGYPQPEVPPGYRQVCFDLSTACSVCGNGARQKAPFMLKKAPPNRREWWMLNWEFEYMLTDRVASLICERGFTGCEFWPLLHYRTKREISGWKQLFITHQLPPMSSMTELPILSEQSNPDPELVRLFGELAKNPPLCPCGKCGRNCPETIYYDREHIDCFKDFNKSAEWLGGGASTWQMKIVSQRVFRFLREQRLDSGIVFTPIVWA